MIKYVEVLRCLCGALLLLSVLTGCAANESKRVARYSVACGDGQIADCRELARSDQRCECLSRNGLDRLLSSAPSW